MGRGLRGPGEAGPPIARDRCSNTPVTPCQGIANYCCYTLSGAPQEGPIAAKRPCKEGDIAFHSGVFRVSRVGKSDAIEVVRRESMAGWIRGDWICKDSGWRALKGGVPISVPS